METKKCYSTFRCELYELDDNNFLSRYDAQSIIHKHRVTESSGLSVLI